MKYYIYNYVDKTKINNKEYVERNLFNNNIGNLFFLQAVCNSVDGDIVNNAYEEEIDAYILPLANMFRGKKNIKEIDYLYSLLKNRGNKNIVITGVGAQGKYDYTENSTDEQSDKQAKEFCEYILQHSHSIGVRGEFTKSYLMKIGVEESRIDVIGCPSVRMFGKNFDSHPRKYRIFDKKLKIAVNFTPYNYMENVAIFIYKIFKNNINSFAMLQDQVEYDMIYNGKEIDDIKRVHALLPTYCRNPIILNNRARMFLSVDEWIRCLSTFDFTIGTRIHGNIIAILAGCPAMVIAIDSRTRELAEYHHMPYISADEINEDTSLELLYYRACAGMNNFYLHYENTLKEYYNFMDKNNIKVKKDWIM